MLVLATLGRIVVNAAVVVLTLIAYVTGIAAGAGAAILGGISPQIRNPR